MPPRFADVQAGAVLFLPQYNYLLELIPAWRVLVQYSPQPFPPERVVTPPMPGRVGLVDAGFYFFVPRHPTPFVLLPDPCVEVVPGLFLRKFALHRAKLRRYVDFLQLFFFGYCAVCRRLVSLPEIRRKFPPENTEMTTTETISIRELAEAYGRKADTLYRKAKRIFPGREWSVYSAVTEDEGRILLGDWEAPEKPAPVRAAKPAKQKRESKKVPAVDMAPPAFNVDTDRRAWPLYGLMVAATAASVQNMYRVTAELSEANMSAWLLTAVLSLSAIVFVLSGVRRWWTIALAALLIAYESMCNMTRIHAGLYTEDGNATRFLGQFCETFNSGTHGSAFFLAAFTAFFIAAVQYAAVF
ncbi:MAG TPA: hypothetical protein P5318_19450, partial [Candidatus Hydrogenedentes bacterium]|nr:hypothetical protein [Candidatus Hydrogenedentota bacterium]